MTALLRLVQPWGWVALLLALAAPALAGPARLEVGASIVPLGDFCRHVGGEGVEVHVMIPPGASPHAFEPTPAAMARLHRAAVFVYVSRRMEPWAGRFLESPDGRRLATVEAVQGFSLLDGDDDHPEPARQEAGPAPRADQEHEHPAAGQAAAPHHRHQGGNPHVWLDPVMAQDICRRIAAALIQVDPEHRQTYEQNLQAYLRELEALHQEFVRTTAAFSRREFVAFHPAFTYLARRYGLREAGIIETSPGREPTPRQLQAMVRSIRKYQIGVVFAEPQFDARVATAIAREAGVQVLLLDPLGGRLPYGSDYIKMMRHNLEILTQAMH